MKSVVILLVCAAVLVAAKAPLLGTTNDNVIPGRYLIVFHENTSAIQTKAHLTKLAAWNQNVIFTYDTVLKGYAAELSPSALDSVRNAEEVDYVEADQEMHIDSCSSQTNAEWGLSRLWQRKMSLHGKYNYDSAAGQGVDAYIIDTGILVSHQDFGGRARWGTNYADTINTDCNGHGTHVAGTVGGTLYGVAKKVSLIAVKVLTCSGSGSNTGVISGIDWATKQAQSSKRPSVINMSLGGGLSTATNQAVDKANDAGITVVVAAGNDNADACNYSPASAKKVLSVGATTIASRNGVYEDARATFSNYGSCVKIFAPGQNIKSTWINDDEIAVANQEVNTISGTSMASPHVCGLAALWISANNNHNPEEVKKNIIEDATVDEIDLLCSNTACKRSPNLMFYHECSQI